MSAAEELVPLAPASETRLRATSQSASDSELIASAAGGDRAAYGELVRRHRPYVYGFTWTLLRNQAEAEDVVQDVFARLLTKLPASLECSFQTFACVVARNLAFNRQRAAKLRKPAEVEVDEVSVEGEATLADVYEDAEARASLRNAVEGLSPTTRAVVIRLLDGESRRDVAAAMGITEMGVNKHFWSARQKLAPESAEKRARPVKQRPSIRRDLELAAARRRLHTDPTSHTA